MHPPVTDWAFERTSRPDLEAARASLVEEWGVPESAVALAFEQLDATRAVWA